MLSDRSINEAYTHCRTVTLRHARTFYFASVFLPRRKRNACYAVYAFCRYIDDLVDRHAAAGGAVDCAAVNAIIRNWQSDLDNVYAGRKVGTPVMTAWADTLRCFNIGRELPDLLIEGIVSDLRANVRFADFDELRDYCYKVASVVGLMTCAIFGYRNPAALEYAADLGIAMQLTNILRDINEDFTNGRIYLPRTELLRFGLDEASLSAHSVSGNFRRMMQFQIERARDYYARADRGIAMLEPDSRLTVSLMSHNYQRILGVIERNGYDVFTRRASVPLHRKLMTVPVLWYATR